MIPIKNVLIVISICFISNQYIQAALPIPAKREDFTTYIELINNPNIADFKKIDMSPEAVDILLSTPINEQKNLLNKYLLKLLFLYHPDKNRDQKDNAEIIGRYLNNLRDNLNETGSPIYLIRFTKEAQDDRTFNNARRAEEDSRFTAIRTQFATDMTQNIYILLGLVEAEIMNMQGYTPLQRINEALEQYLQRYRTQLNPDRFEQKIKARQLYDDIVAQITLAVARLHQIHKNRADQHLAQILAQTDFDLLDINERSIQNMPREILIQQLEQNKAEILNELRRFLFFDGIIPSPILDRINRAAQNIENKINDYHARNRTSPKSRPTSPKTTSPKSRPTSPRRPSPDHAKTPRANSTESLIKALALTKLLVASNP